MTKALVAVHNATYGGVYYSETIDFLNLGTQPTWTRLATTGLANLLIKQMQNDYFDPYNKIYVMLDNQDVYRWNGTSWTKILDLATAQAIGPGGEIKNIYVDRKTAGTIWAALNPSDNVTAPSFIRSLDYGANWALVANTISGFLNTGLSHFVAHGNYLACVFGHIYNTVWYSADTGANWTEDNIWGNSGGTGTLRQDTSYPDTSYHVVSAGNFDLLAITMSGWTTKQSTYQLGSYFYDRMWIDPVIAGHHRVIRHSNNDKQLFATTDRWTTLVDSTPDVLASTTNTFGALAAAYENNAFIMVGDQSDTGGTGNQRVFGIYGETASSWTGIAGTNHNTSPYTNAIPSVANLYVAIEGIYVGNAPVGKGIEVYSVETDVFDYDHEPMKGDRSAHHTLTYPDEHAEDVAKDTPYIHTPYPGAIGSGIVSDGTKWTVGAPGGAAHNILSATHTDTDAADVPAEGDALVYRSAEWVAEAGVDIGSDAADIDWINVNEQAGTPAQPGAGHWLIYAKSDGFYQEDDAGVETKIGTPVTLDADADTKLSISAGQQLSYDTQAANTVLAGPTSGAAAKPNHRALVAADLPVVTSVDLPYGSFSSSANQTIANATTAYAITYTDNEVTNQVTLTESKKINILVAGTYLITFSAVGKSGVANKYLDIWLAVDGTNVPRSNTHSKFVGSANERIITVTYIYDFTAGQYFELYMHSDDTNTLLAATAAGANPTRPASPSIIVTVNKISDTNSDSYLLMETGDRLLLETGDKILLE